MFYSTVGTSFFTLSSPCRWPCFEEVLLLCRVFSSTGLREKKGFSGLPC